MSTPSEVLRAQIAHASVKDPFEQDAVIRFTYRGYSYLALKKEEQWYTTSIRDNFVPLKMDYEMLLRYLSDEPNSVEIAIAWEPVV